MRVEVSFRIAAEALDPDVVTEALGITPDVAHRKGDIVDEKVGTRMLRMGPFRAGIWSVRSQTPSNKALDFQIQTLLALLEPKGAAIRELVESGCSADFFCGLFMGEYNDGEELSPETLDGIAALGAKLSLDIYDPSYGASAEE
jgi:hypothetical protein